MKTSTLSTPLVFQRQNSNGEWRDHLFTHAYINGVSGDEFFIANAGYEASLVVTITCRFQLALMRVTPMIYRAKTKDGAIYELLSPGDDVQFRHREVKFRAKRIYTMENDYGRDDSQNNT